MKRAQLLVPAIRAILALGLVLFLGEVVFRRNLVPLLGIRLTDTPDFRQWPGILYLGILFPATMTTLALLLTRFLDRRSVKEIGLSMDPLVRRVSIVGTALMAGGFIAFVGITALTGILKWRISSSVAWRFFFAAAVTYLGTGLWEEFFFRGYLYRTLKAYGKPVAYIVSITLFSAIHFTEETLLLPRLFNLLLVSFFLTLIYDRSGSIWPGVILHGSWNLLGFLTVSNQFRVALFFVQGPAGEALRWYSTLLHLALIALVLLTFYGRSGGSAQSPPTQHHRNELSM